MKIDEATLAKIEQHARVCQDVEPGPWAHVAVRFMQHEVHSKHPAEEGYEAALCSHSVVAEHIANCSPDVVLALVARVRELEAAVSVGNGLLRAQWSGVYFNCPACSRMLKNEPPE